MCTGETRRYRRHVSELRVPLTHRLRPEHLVAIDCAVAVFLAVAYQGAVKNWALVHHGPDWPEHLLAGLVPLPIAVRRWWPAPVLGLVLAGTALMLLIGSQNPPIAVALALYMVGAQLPRRRAIAALAAVLITIVAVAFIEPFTLRDSPVAENLYGHVSSDIVVITAAWTIGFAVRQRRAYTAGLQEQAARRARAQMAEERLRIARDMHDIVAHSMSLIAVQAGGANYVIGQRPDTGTGPPGNSGDHAMAECALISIEGTSRAALVEMRRLLGVLRDVDGTRRDPELEPAPELADLGRLVAAVAHAGVQVDLEVQGRPRELPPGVEVAAYRIVQEALTNVIKHANASASRVVVVYEDEAISLEITDKGRGGSAGDGHGITGMRERVGLFGGTFEAAALPGRGFRVAARLPLHGVSA
jgi:signal transduction histidine kinase